MTTVYIFCLCINTSISLLDNCLFNSFNSSSVLYTVHSYTFGLHINLYTY